MSNILFALYHDFSANSAIHVHNFANRLSALGHSLCVAIPQDENLGRGLGAQEYSIRTFDQVDGNWSACFDNGAPPDIFHAWTPRENVRLFYEKVASLCACALFVHLEDNEELILESNLGMPFARIAHAQSLQIPKNLAHPQRYREFIAAAAGVTIIIDRLEKFVPKKMPRLILWPGADRELFEAAPRDEEFMSRIGIPAETTVLCYTGNVHSANAQEVRSLYLAAAILDREGIPTRLVRAGRDFCAFLGPNESWARKISIELGYINHVDIPGILNLADVLVQPGSADRFNEYRLPAKLPEFFAVGRPVILPRTNVGRFTRDGEDALVLDEVNALTIVDAIQLLRRDARLRQRLSQAALAFCDEHFDWSTNAVKLERFYSDVLERRKPQLDAVAGKVS